MATQHDSLSPTDYIPDGDHRIRAPTCQVRVVWTPVEVVEGGQRTLHDPLTPCMFDLPQSQGTILTATEQMAAIGCEGQAQYIASMSVQHCPQRALLAI